jgi:hypothetical protein
LQFALQPLPPAAQLFEPEVEEEQKYATPPRRLSFAPPPLLPSAAYSPSFSSGIPFELPPSSAIFAVQEIPPSVGRRAVLRPRRNASPVLQGVIRQLNFEELEEEEQKEQEVKEAPTISNIFPKGFDISTVQYTWQSVFPFLTAPQVIQKRAAETLGWEFRRFAFPVALQTTADKIQVEKLFNQKERQLQALKERIFTLPTYGQDAFLTLVIETLDDLSGLIVRGRTEILELFSNDLNRWLAVIRALDVQDAFDAFHRIGNELLRALFHMNTEIQEWTAELKRLERNLCQNKQDPFTFEDVEEIEDGNFLMTDDRTCYNAEALTNYIKNTTKGENRQFQNPELPIWRNGADLFRLLQHPQARAQHLDEYLAQIGSERLRPLVSNDQLLQWGKLVRVLSSLGDEFLAAAQDDFSDEEMQRWLQVRDTQKPDEFELPIVIRSAVPDPNSPNVDDRLLYKINEIIKPKAVQAIYDYINAQPAGFKEALNIVDPRAYSDIEACVEGQLCVFLLARRLMYVHRRIATGRDQYPPAGYDIDLNPIIQVVLSPEEKQLLLAAAAEEELPVGVPQFAGNNSSGLLPSSPPRLQRSYRHRRHYRTRTSVL